MTTTCAVCPRCQGRGSIVNPGVDGNGLTSDDIDELGGADFLEDYLGGVYDVRCPECQGERVVVACRCGQPVVEGVYHYLGATPDDDAERPYSACYEHLAGDEKDMYDDNANTEAIYAAERRMGA